MGVRSTPRHGKHCDAAGNKGKIDKATLQKQLVQASASFRGQSKQDFQKTCVNKKVRDTRVPCWTTGPGRRVSVPTPPSIQ